MSMLDRYIGECMISIIRINNGIKEPIRGYQNCNTNQILIFGGYVKVRESLYTRVVIWVSTNIVRRELHETCLGSLEKQKKSLLTAKNVHYMLEFAQRRQDWTIHDWYRVIFTDDIKIN